MSFRVTEIWIRILTLLSLGPPNIIPELFFRTCNRKESTNASSLLPSHETPSVFSPLIHEPGVWANLFLSCPLPALPSRLDKGHHPIPFSSRIVSKCSLSIFFNYTFFLLKPYGATWKTGKEAVMEK